MNRCRAMNVAIAESIAIRLAAASRWVVTARKQ